MDHRIYNRPQPILPPGEPQPRPRPQGTGDARDFSQVLQETRESLAFSRHAQQRLESRNIQLSGEELDRLQGAVQRARDKGARDSLVLMDDLAFVVSIKNQTVVTAMTEDNLREHVFTNIDSAVIAR